MLKRSETDGGGGAGKLVTALSALGMFCFHCCQWSWCTIGSNLKHFCMCFHIIFRQDCGKNAIIKERTWLTRKWDIWASKSLLYWIYVISLSFCMWPAFLTASYYQNPITTAAAISFASSEERDNPSASYSPVLWVRFLPGGLMVSWRELFLTGLSKKQCAHESQSGREGNKSIDLKVLNDFFSLSFPCPHWSITRCAKAGNVLMVAGKSRTESFSHCASKPEVSQPPKPDQCVPVIPALVRESCWEKNQTTVQQPPLVSPVPLQCTLALVPLTSSRCYLLWQGSSAGPWVCFFCSTLPCRGSRVTANAVHSAHFIPRWKAARPEVEHGKRFAAPGNSRQLLKTSGEESGVQTQGNFHTGRM